jgi:hypothetical protein
MKIRKPTPAGAVLATVALVLSLALVPAALAGKSGGGRSGGTVTGPVMVVDNNGDGLPNWGDTVTFNVSSSATYPSVELDCYQNGALVDQQITGFYPTYMWSNNYILSSYYWTGGAASCTATLYTTSKNGSKTVLATLSFSVNA